MTGENFLDAYQNNAISGIVPIYGFCFFTI